jgi:hypothetical protein
VNRYLVALIRALGRAATTITDLMHPHRSADRRSPTRS